MAETATAPKGKGGILGLSGNARVCILLLPLWGIPYSIYYFYLGLYLRARGISDAGLGSLMLALSAASVPFSLLAAPLVDHMGRKRSTLVFDLVSSALPPLIFALSGGFAFALVGFVLTGANKVMSVGYYLLMSEDQSDDERVRAFNLFNLVIVAAGLLIPATGGLVERFGIVATERAYLLASAASMTALAFARNRLVTETSVGRTLRERSLVAGPSAKAAIAPYGEALRYLAGHPAAVAATAANVLFYVYYLVGTNNSLYFAPFFGDALGIGERGTSVLGSVYAAGTLAAMLAVNPAARRKGVAWNALAGTAVNAGGIALLVLAPRGSFAWAAAAVALSSLGYGMLKSAVDAAIVVTTEGEARSGVYSIANALSSLLGIGAGLACGAIYPRGPKSIYVLSLAVLAAIALSIGAGGAADRRARQAER